MTDNSESENERTIIAKAARTAWLNWRMRDVPQIYHSGVPETNDARELWEAEQIVRRKVAVDLELTQSPWRRVGQGNAVLFDRSRLSDGEWDGIHEDLEVVPPGCTDGPKLGRESETRDEMFAQQANSTEFKLWEAFVNKQAVERQTKQERMEIFCFDYDNNAYYQFLEYLFHREERRVKPGFNDDLLRRELGVVSLPDVEDIEDNFCPSFVRPLVAEFLYRRSK